MERLVADPVAVVVLLALAVHAVAGEPTPDRPGAAAAVTAGLLALALGGGCLAAGGRPAHHPAPAPVPPWSGAGLGLLVVGLAVLPFAAGALRGWPVAEMVRDLIGLAALAAPVLLFSAVAGRADPRTAAAALADAVTAGLVLIGIGYAVRFLAAVEAPPGTLGVAGGADGGRYLAGDPAVVFAAVLLCGWAVRALASPRTALTQAIAAGAAAAPCLLVLAMTLQRAALAVVAAAVLAFVLGAARRRPAAAGALALAAVAAVPAAGPDLYRLSTALWNKTQAVGTNHRVEEIVAVAEALSADPVALLAGQGWGALIPLPAIADVPVSFVHALPLYLLWKTGLAGLALGVAWIALLARPIPALLQRRPEEAAAVLAALAVSMTVLPGFKTLSFALILACPILRSAHDRR